MSGKTERPIEEKKVEAAALPSVSARTESRPRKICITCGLKPTISDSCPYCPSCMNKKGREAKKAKISPTKARVKRPMKDKAQPGKTPSSENMAVNIDFDKHPHVLKQVSDLADQEIRPLDLQIIYLLKHHFETDKAFPKEV